VPNLITITIGIVVGLLCRRYAVTRPAGAVSDALVGITGAFAARWFMDTLRLTGLNFGSYNWIFVVEGAVLLLWCVHGFRRRSIPIPQIRLSGNSVQDAQARPQRGLPTGSHLRPHQPAT
jgi:uncharacterized membrane protein YeaQ/YmgE (transglycosylase-associated protein family)